MTGKSDAVNNKNQKGNKVYKKISAYYREVKKLAKPLSLINIKTFFFIRISEDNKILFLSNDKRLLTYFYLKKADIGRFLAAKIEQISRGKISFTLWPLGPDNNDEFLSKLYELDIWNGISIHLRLENYIEVFSFATDRNNTNIYRLYLNYPRLLKRFIVYFRLHNRIMVEKLCSEYMIKLARTINLNYDSNWELNKLNEFRDKLIVKRVIINTLKKGEITLTKRESEYLRHLFAGESTKSIGKKLGVSQNTVISNLEKLKLKTGYWSKAGLLDAFFKSQINIYRNTYYGRNH